MSPRRKTKSRTPSIRLEDLAIQIAQAPREAVVQFLAALVGAMPVWCDDKEGEHMDIYQLVQTVGAMVTVRVNDYADEADGDADARELMALLTQGFACALITAEGEAVDAINLLRRAAFLIAEELPKVTAPASGGVH